MDRKPLAVGALIVGLAACSWWLDTATRVEDPALTNDRSVFEHLPGMLRTRDGAFPVPAPAREPRLDGIDGPELLATLRGGSYGDATGHLGEPDHLHPGEGRRYACWWSVARAIDPDHPERRPVVHLVAIVPTTGAAAPILDLAIVGSGGHRLDRLAADDATVANR